MPVEGCSAPNTRFFVVKSPDHFAVSPRSCLAANCAALTAVASESELLAHRYGACRAASAFVTPVTPSTRIFFAASSAAKTGPLNGAITANGFSASTVNASARCAASSSGTVTSTTTNSIVRPQVLKLCREHRFPVAKGQIDVVGCPVARSIGAGIVFEGSVLIASWSSWLPRTTTTLIVFAVTPIVVAPPLLSPFFSGRVQGGRAADGKASLPSGPQFGEFFAAAVPTPAAGILGPTFTSAPATDESASASATEISTTIPGIARMGAPRCGRTSHGVPHPSLTVSGPASSGQYCTSLNSRSTLFAVGVRGEE